MKLFGSITAMQFIAWVNCDGMQCMFFIVIGRVAKHHNRPAVFSLRALPLNDKKRALHAVQAWVLG